MSTLKSINSTSFPALKLPLDKKENRSINVAKCMLFQIKKLGITIKGEQFLASFTKSLNEVERHRSAPYHCFDCDSQKTAQFIHRLKINLSEGGQNFSIAKLGYLLALSLGFDKYFSLLNQLDAYQDFITKPWYFCGKEISKPLIRRDRAEVNVFLPLESVLSMVYGTSTRQDISVCTIMSNDPEVAGHSIYFAYIRQYHGRAFRTFGISHEDAMAWLIVHAIYEVADFKLWDDELKYHRASIRYEGIKSQ